MFGLGLSLGIGSQNSGANQTDQYFSDVALLIDATGKSDGTGYTTDNSSYGHTILYGGGATITNEAFVFDGVDSRLAIADSDLWAFSGSVTIEIFGLYLPSGGSGGGDVLTQYDSDGQQESTFTIAAGATGNCGFNCYPDGYTATGSIVTSQSLDAYHDVAFVWDGTNRRAYLDGAYVTTASGPATFLNVTAPLKVGDRYNVAGANYLNGRVKAIRITRGVERYTHTSGSVAVPSLPLPTS